MKILLALDYSQSAQAALHSVVTRPWPHNAEFNVLHVVEPLSMLVDRELTQNEPQFENVWAARHNQARELIAKAAEKLTAAGLKVTTAVEEGDPKSVIIDIARDWHADLIVLGSHGWKGFYRFTMGSVSEAVVRHAHCSVEVIRMPAEA